MIVPGFAWLTFIRSGVILGLGFLFAYVVTGQPNYHVVGKSLTYQLKLWHDVDHICAPTIQQRATNIRSVLHSRPYCQVRPSLICSCFILDLGGNTTTIIICRLQLWRFWVILADCHNKLSALLTEYFPAIDLSGMPRERLCRSSYSPPLLSSSRGKPPAPTRSLKSSALAMDQ